MKNKFLTYVITAIIAILIILVIWRIDSLSSHDTTKAYSEKDLKAEEALRTSVPVSYGQFADLMVSFKNAHPVELNGMDVPMFDNTKGITQVDISKLRDAGRSLLTGTNMKIVEWCKDKACVFPTTINENNDTVVSCPADLMVRLVKNQTTANP